ncbi:MAG: hypothetical protein ACREL7_07930 [Longimicrobiales bacterium]
MKRIALLPLVMVLAAGCMEKIAGPPPGYRAVELVTVAEGISGTAAITDVDGPTSGVSVTLRGVTLGTAYTGRVISGSCVSPGGVAQALAGITAATTSVRAHTLVVADSVLTAGHAIAYSRDGTTVTCGDIE